MMSRFVQHEQNKMWKSRTRTATLSKQMTGGTFVHLCVLKGTVVVTVVQVQDVCNVNISTCPHSVLNSGIALMWVAVCVCVLV